ncbi:MAG: DNA repair protein RecO [Thermoanaerobaculia bacterium]|nr:MAG: DNA repair protein RecO [Thermoanaerobaculia bacterium]MBZ0101761.1 DNA repair protein RecO [Thermoanaerobaculia bacterium]
MGLRQAEAILLGVHDLQEADRIVEFLTREQGKRRGVARGARRRFSRFAGELQPLARARVTWFEKEGRELVRISSVELVRAPRELMGDLEGLLLSTYLGETLSTFAQEGEPAEALFRLTDAVLAALAAGADVRTVVRYFESWVLRLAGVFPPPLDCPLCGRELGASASLAASGEALLCRDCARTQPGAVAVSAAALEFWRRIGREGPAAVAARPPGEATLEEVGEVSGRVRRHFLGHELRSLEVLRRTLGSAGAGSPA